MHEEKYFKDYEMLLQMSELNLEWIVQNAGFNTVGNEISPSIAVDYYGNSYIAYQTNNATSNNTSAGSTDIAVTKLDPLGKVVWTRQDVTFNTPNAERAPTIVISKNDQNQVIYYNHPMVVNCMQFDKIPFAMHVRTARCLLPSRVT